MKINSISHQIGRTRRRHHTISAVKWEKNCQPEPLTAERSLERCVGAWTSLISTRWGFQGCWRNARWVSQNPAGKGILPLGTEMLSRFRWERCDVEEVFQLFEKDVFFLSADEKKAT